MPGAFVPMNVVMSLAKELERLGYTLSKELIGACSGITLDEITALYFELVSALKAMRGDHVVHRPMYPNFPHIVLSMDEGQLYFNAIAHYLSGGKLYPSSEKRYRLPLQHAIEPVVLKLGTEEEFELLFKQLTASTQAWSEQDRIDIGWFVEQYHEHILQLLPEKMPSRENRAHLCARLLAHTSQGEVFAAANLTTATDVLRLAAALSGTDASLASPGKFNSFKRPMRKLLLGLLESCSDRNEAFLKRREVWLRLGERLHPGEMAKRYPQTGDAFKRLRNGLRLITFGSETERFIKGGDTAAAAGFLAARPGVLGRRLDHLLRLDPESGSSVVGIFDAEASRMSTPLLLQIRQHFLNRITGNTVRLAFPKGNTARAYVLPPLAAEVSPTLCTQAAAICQKHLKNKFAERGPLGKVYIDPELRNYMVPFAMRSASRSLRTVARGSRLSLPAYSGTLRLFLWWQNGTNRTDIDLSAVMYDSNFAPVGEIAYYQLKHLGACHSGDIVDAPNGASEFIDLPIQELLQKKIRYIAMTVICYTREPFYELPECFAGWMARQAPGSGEIYEPRTVQDRLDLTSDKRIAIPTVFDLERGEAIWLDLALTKRPGAQANVAENSASISKVLQAMVEMKRPNLYDLFLLHATSRGKLIETPEAADVVLSVAKGTPYRLEEILADWL